MTDNTHVNKNAHNEDLIKNLVEALEDIKATDIQIIDVSDKTSLMDTLVIASGTSTRHIAAVVNSVAEDMKKKGYVANHQEAQAGSDWVLIDFVDLVLHVMLPEARTLYDLESLWSGRIAPPTAE